MFRAGKFHNLKSGICHYISIYIQDSIQRGFEPDLAQTGKKTLSTHRDNAGSEMEPLLEARRLPTNIGSPETAEKQRGDSYG